MRSCFYKRGYPKGSVEKEMGKVNFSGYTRRNKREKKAIPLLIEYNSSPKNIDKNIYI